jgi:hypothetical protein
VSNADGGSALRPSALHLTTEYWPNTSRIQMENSDDELYNTDATDEEEVSNELLRGRMDSDAVDNLPSTPSTEKRRKERGKKRNKRTTDTRGKCYHKI